MSFVDAFWHLANLLAPALVVGGLTAWLVKLLWRRDLRAISWWRLARAASGTAATVSCVGLVAFGRDGRMATYGAIILATALVLWWVGFGQRRR